MRYLCGFTGSNAALAITAKHALLVTDGRYTAQAAQQVKGAEVRIAKGPALAEACRWLAAGRVKHAYYDAEQTTVAALRAMEESLKGSGRGNSKGFFQPLASSLVAEERMVKDAAEIEQMAAAAALGVRLFEHILGFMRPGLRENAVAAELEYRARLWGAEAMSFQTIVASGRALGDAAWHGDGGEAAASRVCDARLRCYSQWLLLGYDAHRAPGAGDGAGARGLRGGAGGAGECGGGGAAGVNAGEVDEAARSVLREAKLADYFTHSTGHGVGIEIHESPRIAMAQQALLMKGWSLPSSLGFILRGSLVCALRTRWWWSGADAGC